MEDFKLESKKKRFESGRKEKKSTIQLNFFCLKGKKKKKNISGQVIPSSVVWGEDLGGRGQTRTEDWKKKKRGDRLFTLHSSQINWQGALLNDKKQQQHSHGGVGSHWERGNNTRPLHYYHDHAFFLF